MKLNRSAARQSDVHFLRIAFENVMRYRKLYIVTFKQEDPKVLIL